MRDYYDNDNDMASETEVVVNRYKLPFKKSDQAKQITIEIYSASETGSGSDTGFSFSRKSTYRYLTRWAASINAETRGITPVSDEEKTERSVAHVAVMWFSANLVLSAYAIGALGPMVYGLNFGTSALTIVVFVILGTMPVAYLSVFGAKLGMRQMVLSRFLMGNITGRIFSLFNVIACIGWCVLNTICSAEVLSMINHGSGHSLPLWAGVLVIVIGTVAISFFGYKVMLNFEKWSWIPNLAIFLVILARLRISGKWSDGPWVSGPTTAGNVLSFGCSAYGYAAAWASYASDYTVYMPRSTSSTKIFVWITCGLTIPLCFTMMLGAACGMGGVNDPLWKKYYNEHSIGGLTYAILVPNSLHAFGSFCCVVLATSTIANNLPSMYTIALSVQAMWEPLARVPRMVWTVVGNLATLAIAIPASYFFNQFLENFMNTISYYAAIYISLSLVEHLVFRSRNFRNYNVSHWRRWDKLALGIAGTASLFIGGLGVALGMCQTYWVGEIARRIGKDGGDVGFELGAAWAALSYLILRPIERKYIGR